MLIGAGLNILLQKLLQLLLSGLAVLGITKACTWAVLYFRKKLGSIAGAAAIGLVGAGGMVAASNFVLKAAMKAIDGMSFMAGSVGAGADAVQGQPHSTVMSLLAFVNEVLPIDVFLQCIICLGSAWLTCWSMLMCLGLGKLIVGFTGGKSR